MGKFDRKGNNFRSKPFGKPPAGRSEKRFELFDAICGRCGVQCQVPFRPTSGKPIYCKDCFNKGGPVSSAESDDLEQINKKLDKIMKALKIH